METGALGKIYSDGEIIIRQGDKGNCMYVIQDGHVEVVKEIDGKSWQLAVLGKGDFFGEMAIFEHELRNATVRALGSARILTVDRRNFLRRIHEDPSLAYHLVQVMSSRIRELDDQVARLKISLPVQSIPPEPEKDEGVGVCKKRLMLPLPRRAARLSESIANRPILLLVE